MGGEKGKPKMNLEEYMAFHEKPQCSDLTLNCLRQIITMHGFSRMHNRPKKDIVDALASIEPMLMPPQRSTLTENISSCAFLSIQQVKEDLEALDWKECPVQWIQTLKSTEENLLASDDLPAICTSSSSDPCEFVPSSTKPVEPRASIGKRRPKKRSKTAMNTGVQQAADADALLPSSSSLSNSLC